MKAQGNPNAPCPSATRFAVQPDSLDLRGLRSATLAVVLLLMASTVASARTENLRWMHNDLSSVAGFVIYYGLSSGNYTTNIDVPEVQPDAQGIFTFTLEIGVPDDTTIYVAMTAYGFVGEESGYSNEKTRGPAPTEPTPVPEPVLGKPGTPYVISVP